MTGRISRLKRPSTSLDRAAHALMRAEGFSMVEMLIAMVILLFVAMALMQTALVTTELNTRNALRDNGTRLAGETLDELRNLEFDKLDGLSGKTSTQSIKVRNMDVNYTVYNTVSKIGTGEIRRIDIRVEWAWRGEVVNTVVSTIHASR